MNKELKISRRSKCSSIVTGDLIFEDKLFLIGGRIFIFFFHSLRGRESEFSSSCVTPGIVIFPF